MSEVCIKVFKDREEVDLFISFLSDQGISATIETAKDEKSGQDTYKLMVDNKDKMDALMIIEESCE